MTKIFVVLLSILIGICSAQPYAAFTNWYYPGCNATIDNYVHNLYIYPVDDSCFTPTGGFLNRFYSYKLTYNATTVKAIQYSHGDCTVPVRTIYYQLGTCTSDFDTLEITIYDTLPPDEYWVSLDIVGYGPTTWETVLVTSYYYDTYCNTKKLMDIQIQGWAVCQNGAYYFCENGQVHYELCTDVKYCTYGCVQQYAPLSNACTFSANTPPYWSDYLDDSDWTYYQASCAGGKPHP